MEKHKIIFSFLAITFFCFGIWFFFVNKERRDFTSMPAERLDTFPYKLDEEVVGFYQGRSNRNGAQSVWIANLRLDADKTAVYSLDSPISKIAGGAETGTWSIEDEKVKVHLVKKGSQPLTSPHILHFHFDRTSRELILEDFSQEEWGKSGLIMSKI